jgi:hypothetical protein
MSNKSLKELIKKRTKLIAELEKLSQLLHGSWVKRYSVCSRPDCKCHQGKRHGPRYYLVINEKGRQRQKYISNSQVQTALTGLAQYRRLQEIVDKITLLNLTMMKEAECESQ